jgi:hypothetical protein
MFPPAIADDHGSRAERIVFRKLKEETPDTWYGVHSVGLLGHATKPWAEIDFVLVTDGGVLCLEVKGGTLAERHGEWFQNERRLKQSPFAQAGGGASALYEYLTDRVPSIRRSYVGHGVLFPESTFHESLPSSDERLVYDDDDRARPISEYVERLMRYWHESIRQKRGREPQGLDAGTRSKIVHALAPDFELVPSLRARLQEVDEELIRLTAQQKQILQGLTDEPRVLVRGGAGTGKTLLACDEAIRLSSRGQRTLYVCYGSRLAAYVRPLLEPRGVTVTHVHGLMREIIGEADLEERLPAVEPRDLFDVHYPEVALDALGRLDRFGTYDALVADEGQDLLKPSYVLFLDAVLAGELAEGTWRLFHDPNQEIFQGAPAELDRLEDLAACYRLTQNCRNTREIAMATSILSGVAFSETLVAEGPEVIEHWYTDRRTEERAVLRQLRDWIATGISPESVTVLTPKGFEHFLLGRPDSPQLPRRIVDISHSGSGEPNSFRFSTVAGFKGLESDAVLLTGFDDLSDPRTLSLLYVGASRARGLLALVLPESCREVYIERARDVVSRMVESEEEAAPAELGI